MMMFENALVATRSHLALHGRGRLSENALGKRVPHKNSEWVPVFPLWCILDCPHGQEESRWFSLAMLDWPNKSTYSWLELFESTGTVQR